MSNKARNQESTTTRYYRSFSSIEVPIRPKHEIELKDALQLPTYYEATFDHNGRLIAFAKHMRVSNNAKQDWEVAFTEIYEYFESGKLKHHTLKQPSTENESWSVDERAIPWSDYLDEFCSKWFHQHLNEGRPPIDRLGMFMHELMTELESDVFRSNGGTDRQSDWAYETITEALPGVKAMFNQLKPDLHATICAFAETTDAPWLDGFDDPPANLYAIVEESQSNEIGEMDGAPAITILPARDFGYDEKKWAEESQIGSISVASIYLRVDTELANVAKLFLLTDKELDEEETIVMRSLLRRFASFVEQILEFARTNESKSQNS